MKTLFDVAVELGRLLERRMRQELQTGTGLEDTLGIIDLLDKHLAQNPNLHLEQLY